jgi:uroporphyrinogen-III synthase
VTPAPGAAPLPVPLPAIAIRPEPGLSATLAQGRALGLAIHGFALFEGEPVDWTAPDPAPFTALLAGSAALFRLGGPGLDTLRTLPVHAVGEATAEAARAAGFAVATVGEGGLDTLAGRLPPGHYLRLAGEAHVPLHPAPGVSIETCVVYRMAALPFPSGLVALLAAPALVLLHSGEAARHFAAQCDANSIDRSMVAIACLAPRIAEMAGASWAAVAVAPQRTDTALLALAGQMCQTGAGRPSAIWAERGKAR